MPTRPDFKNTCIARLDDVTVLIAGGRHDAAVYLIGYILELALKARVMRHLQLVNYPEHDPYFRTHDFPRLRRLAGLEAAINNEPQLFANWSVASDWYPAYRYVPPGTFALSDAQLRLNALVDNPHGILTWLKKRW